MNVLPPEAEALVAKVRALGAAHTEAAMAGRDPLGNEVVAVLQEVRDGLAGAAEDELVAIGTAVMEWCAASYELGRVAARVRRRDFDSGRRVGRAEAAEEAAREAWMLPLIAVATR